MLNMQSVPGGCVACRFQNMLKFYNILIRMLNILALSLNLLVNDNIVITVKLKFIIFTWIGSFIILQLCFTPKEKDGTILTTA